MKHYYGFYVPPDQMTSKQYRGSVGPGSVWPQKPNNNVIKNSPKFRLSVEWVGKTSKQEDFGDVTLAWEDDEQGRKFLFDNFKWKWKYHESTLAREYEEQERW